MRDAHGWHADGMKTQEHLEPRGACETTSRGVLRNSALYVPCSRVQLLCVNVRVLVLVDVICVMLVVLIAHVDVVHAEDTVFVAIFFSWRCTLYTFVI